MAETISKELYKVYRPKSWGQVIGQNKVVKSLQLAVASEKLPTAYLFAGERGCGKTSAAIILAKAINCLNAENGAPCNACDVCINIDAGAQIGVNYISMANKGAVEDVREIVQQARLATSIKRQVWILDEVHNLSLKAFDALLIPLEDSRMPSLFILCTTEIHKIPDTILSRVQSRKFSLVPEETMKKYLNVIIAKEGLDVSEEALNSVVKMGRGSVRDTLSSLERIAETGETFKDYGGRLLEAFCAQSMSGVLSIVAEATVEQEAKGRQLAEQLFQDMRDLMLAASGVDSKLYPSLPVQDTKKAVHDLCGMRGIALVLDEVGDALTRMTLGADGRVHLEIAVVKSLQKLKQLKARMESK